MIEAAPAKNLVNEARHHRDVVVRLSGRYSLANSLTPSGEKKEYACRVIKISPDLLTIVAPVRGAAGEWVNAEIERFGKLLGMVERLVDQRGFVMRVVAEPNERQKLADRIAWFAKYENREVTDQREHSRFVPEHPFSTLLMADGSFQSCFVLDLSCTGAALTASVTPEIGTVLAVGKVIGRVVRHFTGGFAVCFLKPQDRAQVERLALRK